MACLLPHTPACASFCPRPSCGCSLGLLVMAAIFNLNHPPHVAHWHFIFLSVPNVIVLVLMLVVFVLAILLPFPKHSGDPGRS